MTIPLPIPRQPEAGVLALSNAHAVELSPLDRDQLASLLAQAFHARRIGSVGAFLLALDERASYESPNHLWFRRRYPRFVYVDRIVVAPAARGRGWARLLSADLFERAHQAGHDVVVCEVNVDPANPASDAFHTALGFVEVGRATIHDGRKTVRYLSRAVEKDKRCDHTGVHGAADGTCVARMTFRQRAGTDDRAARRGDPPV